MMRNIAQALQNGGEMRMPGAVSTPRLTRMGDISEPAQPIAV
jgi:hypothetical protein